MDLLFAAELWHLAGQFEMAVMDLAEVVIAESEVEAFSEESECKLVSDTRGLDGSSLLLERDGWAKSIALEVVTVFTDTDAFTETGCSSLSSELISFSSTFWVKRELSGLLIYDYCRNRH